MITGYKVVCPNAGILPRHSPKLIVTIFSVVTYCELNYFPPITQIKYSRSSRIIGKTLRNLRANQRNLREDSN
jgi:hypothetical protein